MRHSTDNIHAINNFPCCSGPTIGINGGMGSYMKHINDNSNGNNTNGNSISNKFTVTRTNSTNTTGELDTHGTVSTASVHQSSDCNHHVATDGITSGYHDASQDSMNEVDTGRLEVANGKSLSTLDDIMESPLLKSPVEKWLEAQDNALKQMNDNDDRNRR